MILNSKPSNSYKIIYFINKIKIIIYKLWLKYAYKDINTFNKYCLKYNIKLDNKIKIFTTI